MDWFRSIVMFSAAVGFVQWISPDGTFEPYVKFIVSILTLAVILSPLSGDGAVTAALELPQKAIDSQNQDWERETEELEVMQSYQIREILKDRIRRETENLLNGDFSGITGEDIEVYIEQESLERGTKVPCVITIRTDEPEHEYEIRRRLVEGLRLSQAYIRIERKETEHE